MQGQAEAGIALARQSLEAAEELGLNLHYSQLAAMAAESLIAASRSEEAIAVLDKGIARFEHYHDRLCAPDMFILKGDALLALGARSDAIEACYRQALALARSMGARVSELRAAAAWARLCQGQGRAAEAREELQAIFDGFAEGHDTPDLRLAAEVLAGMLQTS